MNNIELKVNGNMVTMYTYGIDGRLTDSYTTSRHLSKQDKKIHMVEAIRHLKYAIGNSISDDIYLDYNMDIIALEQTLLGITESINPNYR